jgi:predicted PurR-regulated permease PerM
MDFSLKLFTRENVFAVAFLAILLAVLKVVATILSPFMEDFVWALIFAISFYPVYRFVLRKLGNRSNLSAFLLTMLVLLVLIVPGFFILLNLGQEAKKAYEILSSIHWHEKTRWLIDHLQTYSLPHRLQEWGVWPENGVGVVEKTIVSGINQFPKIIVEQVSRVFKNLAFFALHVMLIAVALFFFFRDGSRYAGQFIGMLPMEPRHREIISANIARTVSAVIRGMFVTSLVQGSLAGLGFAVAGVPVPILLGLLTSVTSFIPFLGAASVWIPATVAMFLMGHTAAGVGLGLYGLLVISTVDNIIKPLIIGEGTRIPVFLLFFTILGGLKVYGFLGIFLGPISLSLGMAFLAIYRELYLETPDEKVQEEEVVGHGE